MSLRLLSIVMFTTAVLAINPGNEPRSLFENPYPTSGSGSSGDSLLGSYFPVCPNCTLATKQDILNSAKALLVATKAA